MENEVWKNPEGFWCRKCPKCGQIIISKAHRKQNLVGAHKRKCICLKCFGLQQSIKYSGLGNPMYGKVSAMKGKNHTAESLKKMSEAWTPEMREQRSIAFSGSGNGMFGNTHTPEVRKKLVEGNARFWNSEDGIKQRKKHSDRKKGIKLSEEHKLNVWQASESASYQEKEYTFSDGSKIFVQGYEPRTLDFLIFSQSVAPVDIITNRADVPKIHFEFSGSQRRYYPDAFVSSSNTIVETKSTWTWEKHLGKNQTKISASLDCGYNFQLMIWDEKTLVTNETFRTTKTRSNYGSG